MRGFFKVLTVATCAALLLCCWGCAAKDKPQEKTVDLSEFLSTVTEKYEFPSMEPVEGELLDSFYPGLSDLSLSQTIVRMPMISATASEIALLQAADSDSAKSAAEVLEARKTAQAEGGAWYPASIEQWQAAKIVTHGNYVMLVAHEKAEEIANDFEALFTSK